jgi:hypothetical protein
MMTVLLALRTEPHSSSLDQAGQPGATEGLGVPETVVYIRLPTRLPDPSMAHHAFGDPAGHRIPHARPKYPAPINAKSQMRRTVALDLLQVFTTIELARRRLSDDHA